MQMPPYFPGMPMPGMPGLGSGMPMPGMPHMGGAMGGMPLPSPPTGGGMMGGMGGMMGGMVDPPQGRKGGGGGGFGGGGGGSGGGRKGGGGNKGGGRGKGGAPRQQGGPPGGGGGARGGAPAMQAPLAVGGVSLGGAPIQNQQQENKGGGRKGGGKGKGGGGGKGRWVYRPDHEPMTEEQIAERRQASAARHATRVAEEERNVVTDVHIEGVVVQRSRRHAWLKPNDPDSIPEVVRGPLKQMNEEFRTKAIDGRTFCGGITEDVLYLAVADIAEPELMLEANMPVKFKCYVDTKGVGACEVISNGPAPEVTPQIVEA